MMYFYKIGDYVLESDQLAASARSDQNENYVFLSFNENASVSVVETGDEYVPDEK